jgi:hypothetical protein
MSTAPIDFTNTVPIDVDPSEFTSVPDHNASRANRRESVLGYLGVKPKVEGEESPKPTRRRKKPAPRAKKGAFVEPLTQIYALLGGVMMPFDQHCAGVIVASAESCATAMDELAYQNESVRRALTSLTTGSAMGAVLVAHLPIIMAVVSHHGPGKIPGMPIPQENRESTGE